MSVHLFAFQKLNKIKGKNCVIFDPDLCISLSTFTVRDSADLFIEEKMN